MLCMGKPRFHIETLSVGTVQLSDQESAHAVKSLRLKSGDEVLLFDGRGLEGEGRIISAARASVAVAVDRVVEREKMSPLLTLAVALPKGPRQDVVIEKCTELGIAGLQPIFSERSVCSASEHKLDKWRRKMIEAVKQSGQCRLPELYGPCHLKEVLAGSKRFDKLLIAVSRGDSRLSTCRVLSITDLLSELAGVERVLAFVGPEGGWTDSEITAMVSAGAIPMSLGPNVLRIETAAVALAAMMHAVSRRGPV